MNRFFLVNKGILTVLLAVTFSSCASGPQEIITSTGHYSIIVSQMSLGPNEYYEGNEVFKPKSGSERFVWVSYALTPAVKTQIDYSSMKLKTAGHISGPMRVLSVEGVNEKPIKMRESLEKGATVYRKAIYIMPSDQPPSELILPGKEPVMIPKGVIHNYGG